MKCAVQNNAHCTGTPGWRTTNSSWRIDYFDTEADVGGGSDSILGANGWVKVGMENPQ